jgi:hypothetical protein
MSSPKQIEANRRNAQKSTGPRSVDGKTAASRNALKSGIDANTQFLPGEKPANLESLAAEYYNRYRPTAPDARHLVDTLIANEWLLRRFRGIEVQVVKHEMTSAGSFLDGKNPVGHAYMHSDRALDRLQRRINSAERNYHRALKELQSLPHGFQEAGSASPQAEIGFVPQFESAVPPPAETRGLQSPAPDSLPSPE